MAALWPSGRALPDGGSHGPALTAVGVGAFTGPLVALPLLIINFVVCKLVYFFLDIFTSSFEPDELNINFQKIF